jgi:hypothetical protein
MNSDIQTTEAKDIAAQPLVTLVPETYVQAIYEPFNNRLATAIAQSKDVKYNIQTKEGMEVAVKHRAIFRAIRIEADKERKARKAPIDEIGKLINRTYETIETAVTPHESKFDGDIKAEEARLEEEKAAKLKAEKEAEAAVQNRIDAIKNKPLQFLNSSAEDIEYAIGELSLIIPTPADYAERYIEAEYAIKETISSLNSMAAGKIAQAQLAEQQEQALAAQKAQAAEQSRVDAIKGKIQGIRNFIITGSECETADELTKLIVHLDGMETTASEYQEFEHEAVAAIAKTLGVLTRQRDILLSAEAAEKAAAEAKEADQGAKPEVGKTVESVAQSQVTENQSSPPLRSVPLAPSPSSSGVNTQPSANEIVCALADAFHVDEAMAYGWITSTDFKQYKKAA